MSKNHSVKSIPSILKTLLFKLLKFRSDSKKKTQAIEHNHQMLFDANETFIKTIM